MGEAKRRMSMSQRERQAQPFCVYCGGTTIADDVDHVPPLAIFDGKWRPKDPVVSVCRPCHEGTRHLDSIASAMSRVCILQPTTQQAEDMRKAAKALSMRHRSIALELGLDRLEHGSAPAYLTVGPLLNSALTKFSARLGSAFYYIMNGVILPKNGTIWSRWYSNADAINGGIPSELFDVLGEEFTLKQGKKSVENQFSYSWAGDEKRHVTFCTFRKSFATLAISFSSPDLDPLRVDDTDHMHRPGFLQSELNGS